MNWADLRTALAVARHGTVPEAAKALGVAHTTVYRRLASLEEQHAVRFFDRTVAPWTLTDAGRELLEVGSAVQQHLEGFETRLRGRDQRLEGSVTVATVEPLAVLLARQLHRFHAEHPDIEVVLKVTNHMVPIGTDADIALRVTRTPPEHLRGRRISTIGFAVYAASSLLEGDSLDDTAARWICFEKEAAGSPQGQWEQANVRDEQVVLRTGNRTVFLEAVRLGMGIGVLPCGLAAEIPTLVRLRPPLEELGLPLWLLTHDDLAPMPRVRVLLDFIADALQAMRPRLQGETR